MLLSYTIFFRGCELHSWLMGSACRQWAQLSLIIPVSYEDLQENVLKLEDVVRLTVKSVNQEHFKWNYVIFFKLWYICSMDCLTVKVGILAFIPIPRIFNMSFSLHYIGITPQEPRTCQEFDMRLWWNDLFLMSDHLLAYLNWSLTKNAIFYPERSAYYSTILGKFENLWREVAYYIRRKMWSRAVPLLLIALLYSVTSIL